MVVFHGILCDLPSGKPLHNELENHRLLMRKLTRKLLDLNGVYEELVGGFSPTPLKKIRVRQLG